MGRVRKRLCHVALKYDWQSCFLKVILLHVSTFNFMGKWFWHSCVWQFPLVHLTLSEWKSERYVFPCKSQPSHHIHFYDSLVKLSTVHTSQCLRLDLSSCIRATYFPDHTCSIMYKFLITSCPMETFNVYAWWNNMLLTFIRNKNLSLDILKGNISFLIQNICIPLKPWFIDIE